MSYRHFSILSCYHRFIFVRKDGLLCIDIFLWWMPLLLKFRFKNEFAYFLKCPPPLPPTPPPPTPHTHTHTHNTHNISAFYSFQTWIINLCLGIFSLWQEGQSCTWNVGIRSRKSFILYINTFLNNVSICIYFIFSFTYKTN